MKRFYCVCWISALSLLTWVGLAQNSFGDFVECAEAALTSNSTCATCQQGATAVIVCLSTNPVYDEQCEDTTEDGWTCEEYGADCGGNLRMSYTMADCLNGEEFCTDEGGCDENIGIIMYTLATDDSNTGTDCSGGGWW